MSDKIRLDIALTQRGLAESREKAKALIMAGQVYLNVKIIQSAVYYSALSL